MPAETSEQIVKKPAKASIVSSRCPVKKLTIRQPTINPISVAPIRHRAFSITKPAFWS